MISSSELKTFLDEKYDQYNREPFIQNDPVSIPHTLSKKEDIEIAAFLTATIAWGQRVTIIKNAKNLISLMDKAPHDFIMHAEKRDIIGIREFKHRTFNGEDLTFFLHSLQNIYRHYGGLEKVFTVEDNDVKSAIVRFKEIFFAPAHPVRSRKHVSDPSKGSAAKRINMFLRWMVRNDKRGVDFGLWKEVSPSALFMPLDVHSGNVARKLGLLSRKQNDWQAVEELTLRLRMFDAEDPVKYDFALFGLGVFEKF